MPATALLDAPETKTMPEDIPDVAVPEPLKTALTNEAMAEKMAAMTPATLEDLLLLRTQKTLDECYSLMLRHTLDMDKAWEMTIGAFRKALDGIVAPASRITPYSSTIQAISPSGYMMAFTVQEHTQERFLTHLGTLLGWLKAQGFTQG